MVGDMTCRFHYDHVFIITKRNMSTIDETWVHIFYTRILGKYKNLYSKKRIYFLNLRSRLIEWEKIVVKDANHRFTYIGKKENMACI